MWFLTKIRIPLRISKPIINVLSGRGKALRDYGIEFIPTVFLIDCKTGEILVRDAHPDLESILSGLLP